jgi:hypothetical protein
VTPEQFGRAFVAFNTPDDSSDGVALYDVEPRADAYDLTSDSEWDYDSGEDDTLFSKPLVQCEDDLPDLVSDDSSDDEDEDISEVSFMAREGISDSTPVSQSSTNSSPSSSHLNDFASAQPAPQIIASVALPILLT